MTQNLPAHHILLNRYEILEPIGQGGFGITYKALDRLENDLVCVKELFISGNSSRDGSLCVVSQPLGNVDFAYFKRRFLDEANTLNKIKHENIVKVGEYFEVNDTAYMVMDYIKGQNLKDWIEQNGKLNEKEALELFHQLLNALDAVHKHNILHRDIKPDNIILTPEKKLVLIDFGTAKFSDNSVHNHSTLVIVNHGYAPPEQFSSENPKGNYTDIYALGATLYFMLTGQKPAPPSDRTIEELKPISSFNSDVSKKTQAAVFKALSLKPSERFQTVEDFERALVSNFKVADDPTIVVKTQNKPHFLGSILDKSYEIGIGIVLFGAILMALYHFFSRDEIIYKNTGSFNDSRDGQSYNWVEIDGQVWMSENLNADKFRNGDPIPEAKTWDEWQVAGENEQPAWCYYENEHKNGTKYGKLYNWYATNDPRGLAPEGWRIPSDAEWNRLINFLGGEELAGHKMKSTWAWLDGGNGNNVSGFNGLPGGLRNYVGTFYFIGYNGIWWSSTEDDTFNNALCRTLDYGNGSVYSFYDDKTYGYSVRCLRD
jgi:uncharacterized protein (TIGR02145 family)